MDEYVSLIYGCGTLSRPSAMGRNQVRMRMMYEWYDGAILMYDDGAAMMMI
jgi:hypothetical protein